MTIPHGDRCGELLFVGIAERQADRLDADQVGDRPCGPRSESTVVKCEQAMLDVTSIGSTP
jgi:hypothetical protein